MWFKRQSKNRRLRRGPVLDVKLRSDQVRATRVRLGVMAVSIPLVTLFGLYLFWRAGEWTLDRFVYENAEFAIQRVDVQTDGVITEDQLRRWSGVQPGANLIALDLATVKRNLELEPLIDSVSIERVLPRTLKIRVTERRPVAQVNRKHLAGTGGVAVTVYQLDATGMVMQPIDPRLREVPLSQLKDGPLPVISWANMAQLPAGHRVTQPQVLAALRLVSAFNRSPMARSADLRQIDVSEPGVVVVTTRQGGKITFGLENMEQQLRRWREIDDLARSRNKVIVSLDLAVANNVPLRWTEASTVPAVVPGILASASARE